jgi:sporulation protein YlmC with PRC-barrel domain
MAEVMMSEKAVSPISKLIASDRVEGTPVFDRDGSRLGKVHALMIDKQSGIVAFVVISTGGFLGLGQAYHSLPWAAFRYDPAQEGYVIQIDKTLIEGGPSFRPDTAPVFDEAYGKRVTDYYQLPGGPATY